MSESNPGRGGAPRQSTRPAGAETPADERAAGGLLGASSQYTRKSTTKLKFVPNMRRRGKTEEPALKPEPAQPDRAPGAGRGRGRGRGAGARRALEMTASGPMAQGPAERAWGNRGSGLANAVNGAGRVGGGGTEDAVPLLSIADEDEMSPIVGVAPDVTTVAGGATGETDESKASGQSASPDIEMRDGSSASATPQLAPEAPEAKAEPADDISESFDLPGNAAEQMYIFQFPRVFPALAAPNATPLFVKEEDMDVDSAETKPKTSAAPSRYPAVSGQMGELRIHRSGRVSLVVNNDLEYDVMPAAAPDFLQEVAILNHDASTEPGSTRSSSPDAKVVIMGQTRRKFIVVPQTEKLLEKVLREEQAEAAEAMV